MRAIPEELTKGPFTRARAYTLGVTPKMLRGQRFVRLHPRVYRLWNYEMSQSDLIKAAKLALPGRVHLTGITRIQQLGLDFGQRLPVRFVIEGDHHLAIEGIFLHRTVKLPPLDDHGVSIEAAFIAYCAKARVIDAKKVGDWLLHRRHMNLDTLVQIALADQWRDGANEALWISNRLAGDLRSLPESEVKAFLDAAGLPPCVPNKQVDVNGEGALIGDLVYREYGVFVEYEGTQHQVERAQYVADIDRYALARAHGQGYVQVTKERLRQPRVMVRKVHREFVAHGYEGPAPQFGEDWRTLLLPLRTIVGPRPVRRRSA